MKIILSRKGFDSSYGGIPSPILPDGRLISLPIPSTDDAATLADINCPDLDIEKLICDLSNGKHSIQTRIHLDPDLNRQPQLLVWVPLLRHFADHKVSLHIPQAGATVVRSIRNELATNLL